MLIGQQVCFITGDEKRMKYVDVVIDNKSDNTDNLYTYSAPDSIHVGDRVTVSFARRKKPVDAFVFRINESPNYDISKIKPIVTCDEDRSLNEEMVDTAVRMRRRYGIRYIDAIRQFTPAGKREPKEKRIRGKDAETSRHELTDEQAAAVKELNASIESGKNSTYVLKGVTASGKTEVYMRAAEKALELGKTAIILLPEIALSDQIEKRFKARFGESMVAAIHSRMTTSRRLEEWLRIRRGEARIVVGARTAVFAPAENIGLIVMDEEHEATYKSDHNPKYDSVDIAFMRASYYNATLVLGSATPSIVTSYRARTGVYRQLEMNRRAGEAILPTLEIVDMKPEVRNGNLTCISSRLAEEIDRTLAGNEQIILFLNRRGYSTHAVCMECGHRLTCSDCGITLTYHKSQSALVCHYCGKSIPTPKTCPECGSTFIKYKGTGTEKVEETAASLWPDASVQRFDLDTAASQAEIDRVITSFQKGKTDILVGTQILAKGIDFSNVGLVGIINADSSLNIPDYRSSERTFQLITQVAGRAGRSGGESRVIIQTYEPDNEVIRYAASRDYDGFYEYELLHRNIMNYPPYSDIIYVTFAQKENAEDDSAMRHAVAFREYLLGLKDAPEGAAVLKPRESERTAPGDRKKVSFIIKAPSGSRAGYMNAFMRMRDNMLRSKSDCFIEIDVNPYGMI